MDKDIIAEILHEIGILLELKGENPFKTKAYAAAARALESLTEPLEKVLAENRLTEIKGIGPAISAKIIELSRTGKLPFYEELKASIPQDLLTLLQIPGLGPKKARVLFEKLAITSIPELETACQSGKVALLEGFGEKTQTKILEGIRLRLAYSQRHHLSSAAALAEKLIDDLRAHPDLIRCSPAGSLRRSSETVGDIDLLASSKNPGALIDEFTRSSEVTRIHAKGDTKASVLLRGGIQCDLRVVSDKEFPFALLYFTGSKEHNIALRQRAIQRGLRLNEYGLFRSAEETRDPTLLIKCSTEEEIYSHLGLEFVPPELRENQGEIEASEAGKIPRLLEWTDLKGSLHNHSEWSDGRGSLIEIARHMQDLGFQYWAITDHSKSSFQARGLKWDQLQRQIDEIKKTNETFATEGNEFRLLSGCEVDILTDGGLDFSDDQLAELDVVAASIHQGFTQSEAETTKRLIKAAENPFVHFLGHLTGRLLLEREPYKVNALAVIDACAETGTWIELNANPMRFDMDWRLWHHAKNKGVKCVINCDAHRNEHAGFLRLGAGIARKGWLGKRDVINTLKLDQLRTALALKRQRR